MALSKDEIVKIATRLGASTEGSKAAIEQGIRLKLQRSDSGQSVVRAQDRPQHSFADFLVNNGRVLAEELLPGSIKKVVGL